MTVRDDTLDDSPENKKGIVDGLKDFRPQSAGNLVCLLKKFSMSETKKYLVCVSVIVIESLGAK